VVSFEEQPLAMVIHTTFPDFLLFLYVHVAHIDNTYDPLEISTIKAKMSSLFPEGVDIERKLYQTIREYNAFDQAKINELWQDSFNHFHQNGQTRSSKLYEDVSEIVNADGSVHPMELEVLRRLKSLIDDKA
jgi:uncharacterized tellurite resistance protein B-like protein